MKGFIVYSDRYICEIGPHVFPIDKYLRVAQTLKELHHFPSGWFVEPRPATRMELEETHDPGYLDDFLQLKSTKRTIHSELPLNPSLRDLSLLSTGGTLVATDIARETGFAFHIGGGWHHAFAGHAEGFCYLNDTAVAIRNLQKGHPGIRTAVIDLDLHQGNGTAGIFRRDPSVFTLSMHQEHLYPIKQQSTLDIGLYEGTRDETYLNLLAPALRRVFEEFQPAVVFYLAGADPFEDDQLGQLKLTKSGLMDRDRMVLEGCRDRRIPVIVLLAGGYALHVEDTAAIHVNTALIFCQTFGIHP